LELEEATYRILGELGIGAWVSPILVAENLPGNVASSLVI